jgi:hypothetical protein
VRVRVRVRVRLLGAIGQVGVGVPACTRVGLVHLCVYESVCVCSCM